MCPLLLACPGKLAVYYHCCTLAKFFKLNKNTKEHLRYCVDFVFFYCVVSVLLKFNSYIDAEVRMLFVIVIVVY